MTDQEINVAIAEAVGFVPMVEQTIPYRNIWSKMGITYCECDLPDYCNDLNAMADAEQTLADWVNYRIQLSRVVGIGYTPDLEICDDIKAFVSAKASQRAEAFLKCKGLWREAIVEKGTE